METESRDIKRRNDRPQRPRRRPGSFRPMQRRACNLCRRKIEEVDYKEVELLKNYITERGKILPRSMIGTCARHQRSLTKAIKRARNMGLLPYSMR